MKNNESILVVDRTLLPPAWLALRTALPLSEVRLRQCLDRAAPAWRSRAEVETDPACKQPIPYAIVADAGGRLAVYPRQGSEQRLHGLWSAGVGGHVNPGDQDGAENIAATLKNGLRRELAEEFARPPEPGPARLLGVINEEESAVGRVHLGIVFLVEVEDAVDLVAGAELAGLRWLDPGAAAAMNLELWSRLALSLLPDTAPRPDAGWPNDPMTG